KEAKTDLIFKWEDKEATLEITQEEFAVWAEPLLLRLRRPLERALRDARVLPQQVDQIIMVGGATRIPVVRKLVTKLFGRFPSTSV
ncbi:Hsp70 family protein, partial [Acinetobacter baumannii]